MTKDECYRILELPNNADDKDIKSAYRKLAFQYHPDKNPGKEKEATEKLKKVTEAYKTLISDHTTGLKEFETFNFDTFSEIFKNSPFGINNNPFFSDFLKEEIFKDTVRSRGFTVDFDNIPKDRPINNIVSRLLCECGGGLEIEINQRSVRLDPVKCSKCGKRYSVLSIKIIG